MNINPSSINKEISKVFKYLHISFRPLREKDTLNGKLKQVNCAHMHL